MPNKLKPANFSMNAEIERIFMGKVKPIGNGAMVIVPKDFLGEEVFVLVLPSFLEYNSDCEEKSGGFLY